MRSAQWDTDVSYTNPTSNYIAGYLVYPLTWEKEAISKVDTESETLRWSRDSNLLKTSKLGLKTLYCTEWKVSYEADLPTERLQWQPNWWLMSQFFHSDGECICSLCMDPKWQWLTLQGVRGGHLNPCGPGGHVDASPLSESWGDPPTAHKAMLSSPRPWRHGYEPSVLRPRDNTHTHTKSITVLWF